MVSESTLQCSACFIKAHSFDFEISRWGGLGAFPSSFALSFALAMPTKHFVFNHRVWGLHSYTMPFRLNLVSSFKWMLYSHSQQVTEFRERRSCSIMFINVLKLCAHLFWVWKKSKLVLQKIRRSESIN